MFPRVAHARARGAALVLAAALAAPAAAEQTRPASSPDALLAQGERLVAENRLADAAAIATKVLAARPESARAHYLLGLVRDRERRLDEAAAAYREALARAPNMAEAHDRLGYVLGLQGRTDEAIAEFERAVAIRPSLFD